MCCCNTICVCLWMGRPTELGGSATLGFRHILHIVIVPIQVLHTIFFLLDSLSSAIHFININIPVYLPPPPPPQQYPVFVKTIHPCFDHVFLPLPFAQVIFICVMLIYKYMPKGFMPDYVSFILFFLLSFFFFFSVFFFDIIPSWRPFSIHAHHIPACFIVYKLLPIQRDRLASPSILGLTRFASKRFTEWPKRNERNICVFAQVLTPYTGRFWCLLRLRKYSGDHGHGEDRCPTDIVRNTYCWVHFVCIMSHESHLLQSFSFHSGLMVNA